MDFEQILEQTKVAEKAIDQMKIQTRNFQHALEQAIKHAPEADKPKMEEIRVLSIQAMELAKQGKTEAVQELIKKFENDGRQG